MDICDVTKMDACMNEILKQGVIATVKAPTLHCAPNIERFVFH